MYFRYVTFIDVCEIVSNLVEKRFLKFVMKDNYVGRNIKIFCLYSMHIFHKYLCRI